MNTKKLTALSLMLLFSLSIVPNVASAQILKKIKTPTAHAQETEAPTVEKPVSCQMEETANKEYSAQFIAARKKGAVDKEEIFETQVFIKNTGNTPWFSATSGCPYLITNLGTDNTRDRVSNFFTNNLLWDSGWADTNRITMKTKRVDPGEMAIFSFWSRAPKTEGYFREYFTPVIEGVTWIDSGKFSTEVRVGNPTIDFEQKQYWPYIEESTDLTSVDLSGGKTIDVNVSTQRMELKIGETVIRKFPVSTGKASTPSPLGTTTITHKQEVRVAGGYPHYIMPKWMTFRGGGYGIHALPSLGNDNGVFWREALNHIGSARSHGCIRLLPQDAEYAYSFAEIGTKVVVHR